MQVVDEAPPPPPPGPSNTIYIKNLNDKARKSDLKYALYVLFSAFGPILEIIAMKTQKMKGQAFIVFSELGAAEAAMAAMQGKSVFGKTMILQYAKSKSKIVAKADGTWVEPTEGEEKKEEEKKQKKKKEPANPESAAPSMVQVHRPSVAVGRVPPNKTLFIQNLPENISAEQLTSIFSVCSGLKEVRVVPGNRGLAFVEFADERQSTVAMNKLQSKQVSGKTIFISYQKRVD